MKRITVFFAALLFSVSAFAQLTSAQLSSLRTVALSDQTATAYYNNGNDTQLADWFNVVSTKIVWRSSLMPNVMRNAIVDGASQLDNLTVGKRDALLFLVNGELPNTTTLRTTLDDLCGTQNTLKASIQAAEKRPSTIAEGALATGTGTTASPGTLAWEGAVTGFDISMMHTLP